MNTAISQKYLSNKICPLLCMFLPSLVLSCEGKNGKNGVTPVVLVAAAECSADGSDLNVLIANGTAYNAIFPGYSDTPQQYIYCRSGVSVWILQEPTISIKPNGVVLVSLTCLGSYNPAYEDEEYPSPGSPWCSAMPAQPIECYSNSFVSTTAVNAGLTSVITSLTCSGTLPPVLNMDAKTLINNCGGELELGLIGQFECALRAN